MIRLRTLGGVALLALLVGLAGCGNRSGDLGAERDESAPVVRNTPAQPDGTAAKPADAAGDVVELPGAPADATAATAPAAGELVAIDRSADRAKPLGAEEGQPPAAEPVRAPEDGGKTEPKADGDKPVAAGEETPKPPPPPAEETPEQKAERLLKEAERLSGVKAQAGVQEADAAYQAGLKLFNDLEYEEAKKYFERALALNPAHPQALQKLRTVNALLGIHADRMAVKIRDLEERERVKIQESVVALGQSLEEARVLEERASAEPVEVEVAEKERVLQEQLDNLRKAQDRYRRVKEIINWLPPTYDLPAGRAQVDAALVRVRQKIAQKQDEIDFLRRVQAQKAAEDARVRETELFRARIDKLLEQVKDRYDCKDYKGAERLAIRVLQLDPFNGTAESWKSRARAAHHANENATTTQLIREETRRTWDDVEEASISIAPLISYPADWDRIARRAERSIGRQKVEETWKSEIKKKLQRKVTFEFVDTPLVDAVAFLRDLANVTMVVDPKVVAAAPPAITLRVTDMPLDLALDWILRLDELTYSLKDNAVYISKEGANPEAVELRIYDVSDLTQSIPDFPGPEMWLVTQGDTSQQAPAGAQPFGGGAQTQQQPTLPQIAEMIRNRVAPASWDAALGTAIEERAGRLVVMQRPEVHALIDQLLSNFRSTQHMMINIESRFLQIREAYMEDVGVEYQGLDPNVLLGDFGDLRRLGGASGFLQPRRAGQTDSTNQTNIPFPGMTNGPDGFAGGTMSEVGSIVNHVINFFSNDPDTISGRDGINGRVQQGGMSAQVTVLNNMQVQAFIRALAVRETESYLMSPRLTVFNTQRASMFVARQQSYVADYDISGDSYDPQIRQFLVGCVLDVRPTVSSDRRYVTMELRPTVTDLVNFITRQIDSYTVNNGTVTVIVPLSFPIQFPELAIRRMRTTVTVPDGGILLMGGLYRNVNYHAENGVPFLSDLPVIGRLFRWNTVDSAKSNLAILVSPRIIIFTEEEEKL